MIRVIFSGDLEIVIIYQLYKKEQNYLPAVSKIVSSEPRHEKYSFVYAGTAERRSPNTQRAEAV